MNMRLIERQYNVLPGFNLAFGISLFWLGLIVLLPFATLIVFTAGMGWEAFWHAISTARVLDSIRLSFVTALYAALINAVFGSLAAWVLVRYAFPGRRLLDAMIDLPFALPTAVAGIALATLYAPSGFLGRWLVPLGVNVAFTPLGIVVALTFIGLPFVVRTLQPVLEGLEREVEEAAGCLGASRIQIVGRVIMPALLPALLTGVGLAFSRAAGEYGSVIFIAGNIPRVSEIAPLIIVSRLGAYDRHGATAVAVVMLLVAFFSLMLINVVQWHFARRGGATR